MSRVSSKQDARPGDHRTARGTDANLVGPIVNCVDSYMPRAAARAADDTIAEEEGRMRCSLVLAMAAFAACTNSGGDNDASMPQDSAVPADLVAPNDGDMAISDATPADAANGVDAFLPPFSGIYSVSPMPSYTCAGGSYSLHVMQLQFSETATMLNVSGASVTMTGPLPTSASFTVMGTNPGSCTENDALTGTMAADGSSFSGTLTVTFTGGAANCLDCTNQSFPVTGTKI
jgi:hypothetical protein